jgi:hypothetical protein
MTGNVMRNHYFWEDFDIKTKRKRTQKCSKFETPHNFRSLFIVFRNSTGIHL